MTGPDVLRLIAIGFDGMLVLVVSVGLPVMAWLDRRDARRRRGGT